MSLHVLPTPTLSPDTLPRISRLEHDLGYASVKTAGLATTSYGLQGMFYIAASGWGMVNVPNALVRGAFDALHEPGAQLPPSKGKVLNGHITTLTKREVEKIGVDNIDARGHFFRYSLGGLKCVDNPTGWPEVSKVWLIEVKSPEIMKFRRSLGLSPLPNDHPLHITVGVRFRRPRGTADAKTASWPKSSVHSASSDRDPGASKLARDDREMRESPLQAVQGLRGERDHNRSSVANGFPGISAGHGPPATWMQSGETGESSRVHTGELLLGKSAAAESQSSRQSLFDVQRRDAIAGRVGGAIRDTAAGHLESNSTVRMVGGTGLDNAGPPSLLKRALSEEDKAHVIKITKEQHTDVTIKVPSSLLELLKKISSKPESDKSAAARYCHACQTGFDGQETCPSCGGLQKAAVFGVQPDQLKMLTASPLLRDTQVGQMGLNLLEPNRNPSFASWDQQRRKDYWDTVSRTSALDRPRYQGTMDKVLGGLGIQTRPGATALAAQDVSKLAPWAMVFAPNLWERLHGQQGSAAGLASGIYQAHSASRDPVTGNLGYHPNTAASLAEGVHKHLYGPGKSQAHGFTAGEVGTLYRLMHDRGMVTGATPQRAQVTGNMTENLSAFNKVSASHSLAGKGYEGDTLHSVCPHCGKKIEVRDIYVDKKGWTFHRPCLSKGKGPIKMAAVYKLEGDVQGVGLRKTLHKILEEKGLPGLAYNDARKDVVYAHLPLSWRQRGDVLDAVRSHVETKPDRKFKARMQIWRSLMGEPTQRVELSPRDVRTTFVNQGLTDWAKTPPWWRAQYLQDRYRLKAENGKLVGDLPSLPIKQIKGEEPIYSGQLQEAQRFPNALWNKASSSADSLMGRASVETGEYIGQKIVPRLLRKWRQQQQPPVAPDVKEASSVTIKPDQAKVELEDVSHKEQHAEHDCGPAAYQAAASAADIDTQGPQADPQAGTRPEQIIEKAHKDGLRVHAQQGMTLQQLKTFIDQGRPVLVAMQAHGGPKDQLGDASGHYVTVTGYDDAHIYYKDPYNKDADTKMRQEDFLAHWHDQEEGGKKYQRLGIAVWDDTKEASAEEFLIPVFAGD